MDTTADRAVVRAEAPGVEVTVTDAAGAREEDKADEEMEVERATATVERLGFTEAAAAAAAAAGINVRARDGPRDGARPPMAMLWVGLKGALRRLNVVTLGPRLRFLLFVCTWPTSVPTLKWPARWSPSGRQSRGERQTGNSRSRQWTRNV